MNPFFNWIRESLKADYENLAWIPLVLKSLLLLLVSACTLLLIGLTAMTIVNNIENILVTVGAIGCMFWFLAEMVRPKPAPALPEPSVMEYDPITLENTYKMIRKNLCTVLGEVGEMVRLKKPASFSQMDAPTHYDVIAKAPIYHYLARKASEEIDPFSMVGILQNSIEQKLNNRELDGITQTAYFYNGQVYPSLMVDNVRDLGAYVQIDIAIASEYYCKYREARIYNQMDQAETVRPCDREF